MQAKHQWRLVQPRPRLLPPPPPRPPPQPRHLPLPSPHPPRRLHSQRQRSPWLLRSLLLRQQLQVAVTLEPPQGRRLPRQALKPGLGVWQRPFRQRRHPRLHLVAPALVRRRAAVPTLRSLVPARAVVADPAAYVSSQSWRIKRRVPSSPGPCVHSAPQQNASASWCQRSAAVPSLASPAPQ